MALLADDERTLTLTGTTAAALSAQPAGPLLAAHARRLTVTIEVTGAGNVTSARWRIRSKASAPWGPWVTATGVAPAAGETATIDLTDTVAWELDLEVTPAADTEVSCTLAGAA